MHADELTVDSGLVRSLLAAQFPHWSALDVEPVRSTGTVHALFRLGSELVVRLPRIASGVPSLEKEVEWLPRLAEHLPLAVPEPVAIGGPDDGYPWTWAVYRWLDGDIATADRIDDFEDAATRLATFVTALQQLDTRGGPPPGPHNWNKGEPLVRRDAATRAAIGELAGDIDVAATSAAWEAALAAEASDRLRVWIHADLFETNLLARDGRLSAVLDFGCLAVGDPASDLTPAWTYLPAANRSTFRRLLAVNDDATWRRARGWALSWALVALSYYKRTNPAFAAIARRTIAAVVADRGR
jgi:aminoglycoside phosphotransferase (APT) family kinase protein